MPATIAFRAQSHGRDVWPAWRRAMPPRTWHQSAGNFLSDVNPANDPLVNPLYPANAPWRGINGMQSIVTAWCGAVWDEVARTLLIAGGGHGDYAGNETYVWDSYQEQFRRLTRPTGAIGNEGTLNDGQESTGVYFDGRLRSFHSYHNFAVRNGVPWYFGGSAYQVGNFVSRPWWWNGADWQMDADVSVGAGSAGVAYDPGQDIFWVLGSGGTQQARKYNPVTKATSTHSSWFNGATVYAKPFFDAARGCLLILNGSVYVMTATGDAVLVTPSGTPPSYDGRSGFAYDSANDRYLVWNGGASIATLTPPPVGQDPKTGQWTWGSITPDPQNTVTPSAPTTNGTFGRFWYSEFMVGCGVLNGISQTPYFFAL